MIVEQAFFHLPEIMLGSGYLRQEYEAGIVGAFSLAVLQVLNGRNIPNPLAHLQYERLFRDNGRYSANVVRYLRADLFVNIEDLFVANRRLAQYGWRHYIWLEAKFLRGQTDSGTRHASNKTTYTANFLADLVRLAVLVPEQEDASRNGRYFLHVYDAEPRWYLAYRRRPWLRALHLPGKQEIVLNRFDEEPQSVKEKVGDLAGLSIRMRVTNFVIEPSVSANRPCYWMYLTRVDSIKVTWGNELFTMALDRTLNGVDVLGDRISPQVASRLYVAPDSLETRPPEEG